MSDPGTWIVETLQLYLVIFPIMASLLLVELQECFYSSAFNHRAAVSSVGGWGLGDGGTMHTDWWAKSRFCGGRPELPRYGKMKISYKRSLINYDFGSPSRTSRK